MKLVIQSSAHVWGGSEKFLLMLARGLKQRGHEIVIACPGGPVRERARESGFRVSSFRPRGAIDFLSGLSFAAWLRKERPDALLIGSWHPISWASFAGRVTQVPRIALRHGIVRRAPSRGTRAYALRHWVDDVITNAPEIKKVWLESLPSFPEDQVHVVLNAVIPSAWARPAAREKLATEAGVNGDTILVGGAGIVTKRKNFDLLIRAFARVRPENTRVVVIGDGPHLPELRKLAVALGVESEVLFTGARENAAETIAGLDVFVLSSRNEGMANVMLEAMAAGTPVIASDISGVRTAIGATPQRPPAGWIFPADDEVQLASLLSDVIADIRDGGHAGAAMATEARWRTEHWFNLERMLDECERILFR
jgi:glycosyltransferase involved in cell wall biosynthesis